MPASGKPVTGKQGTITITNVTGATPSYTVALELKDFSHEGSAEVIKGQRLSGNPFKETGDCDDTGKFTIYVAKSDAGVSLPFTRGDHFAMTGTYGGNAFTGTDCLVKRVGLPSVERGSFCTIEVEWEATGDTFTWTPKIITVA
ncbi:hypothetical protein GC170_14450 [bacterium]|nr:hypothetical protein [bacterium]